MSFAPPGKCFAMPFLALSFYSTISIRPVVTHCCELRVAGSRLSLGTGLCLPPRSSPSHWTCQASQHKAIHPGSHMPLAGWSQGAGV